MLFSGDKAVVYGILKGPSELMSPVDCTASLKGQIRDQPVEYSIPFEVPGNSPSFPIPIIHHLASKALIKDWAQDGGNKKSEIVKLSIESSVVSSHTAFVAIDENNQPVKGAMKTWDITAPILEDCFSFCSAPTQSYQMAMAYSASPVMACVPNNEVMACCSFDVDEDGAVPILESMDMMQDTYFCMQKEEEEFDDRCMRKEEEEFDDRCVEKEEKKYESAPASGPGRIGRGTDSLSSLISLQQADGSWKLDDVIAKVLSKSLKELRDACPVKCDGGVSTTWATVICCVYLELKHPSQKDEWELIAMKAELWLDGQSLPAGADLNKMKDAARKLVA